MKALILKEKNAWPEVTDTPIPEPGEDQVLVELHAAALNHRDVWQTKGLYPGFMVPAILGSDGAGILNDRRVIINPGFHWGGDERYQGDNYFILGMHMGGTFAEYLAIDEDRIYDAPEHLSMHEAAALPLAGLTAYRVLFTRCGARSGDRILISGIGGGVAMFAFQFALAVGAEVYVTSSSPEKIDKAVKMGALGGFDYREKGWGRTFYKETGGADVVVDSAGGSGFGELVEAVAKGGRIGVYGGTAGNLSNIKAATLFFRQAAILGSTMGSDRDFTDMLDFVKKHKISPVIDQVYDLNEGEKAFVRMDKGRQFGKIVLKIRQK